MTVKIHNESLIAEIELYGGKPVSLVSVGDGTQYIWQNTSVYWPDRACLLFPTSGRLYCGTYTHKGKSYGMPLHGFAYTSRFEPCELTENSVTLTLTDSPLTLETFPFRFRFSVKYELAGNTLKVTFSVSNTGSDTMYFALGFHPWFNIPSDDRHKFGDYTAFFPKSERISVCRMSKNVLDIGSRTPLGSDSIRLDPSLFAADVLMLEGTGGEVRIVCENGSGVTVDYGDMPYLGLWNTAREDAHFICTEPMTTLPGRDGIVEEWSERRDIVSLGAGKTYFAAVNITADMPEN